MKISFLMTGLLGLITAAAFAQKGELNNAQSAFDKYETTRNQKAMASIATSSINDAKTAIDKASANEKTANMPQTYALKAAIYSYLAYQDTVASTQAPLFNTASEAYQKAKELDKGGENKKLIDRAAEVLSVIEMNNGVKAYQNKEYDQAYKYFDTYRTMRPEGDTTALFYAGLAAFNGHNYPAAETNLSKLVNTNYSNKYNAYNLLTYSYLNTKDTANAIKTLNDALVKLPNNADLRKLQMQLSLQSGKQSEIINSVQSAITADPKNKTLYYYAGLAYSSIAETNDKNYKVAKDAAGKAALLKARNDNYAKAAEMYRKAVELDPNYFEANLNLGYVLLAPGLADYNDAQKLPVNRQKEYNAMMAKASSEFDAAKPYLVKAVELNPKSSEALNNLWTLYKGKRDEAHAAEVKKQIDALNK